jgi:hypothetical protein
MHRSGHLALVQVTDDGLRASWNLECRSWYCAIVTYEMRWSKVRVDLLRERLDCAGVELDCPAIECLGAVK